MLTKTQIKKIQKLARNDAQNTFDDTTDYGCTPWEDSDPDPVDRVIRSEGAGWICDTCGIAEADWEVNVYEFCEVYNDAFVMYWDSLCKGIA